MYAIAGEGLAAVERIGLMFLMLRVIRSDIAWKNWEIECELEGLLLRETIEEPDEGDLIGKAKPVMRAPTLAELHEIFLG